MSYEKSDFVLLKSSGDDVLVNIPRINFVLEFKDGCRLYFGGGEDDFISVDGTIENLLEIL
jgi:hypothetical protein